MMIHGFQSSHQDFSFGPWKLTASKTHIMKSADVEKLADELHMPSLPEMMFGDNVLRIQHGSGFGIEFNATDALRCVNNYQGMLKVACAEEWQESRTEGEHSKEVIKPYDWTYTTDYKGTLLGESLKLKVVPTTDHIDTEKLKAREQIKFFEEVLLFEDELHDHGVSSLSVKICSVVCFGVSMGSVEKAMAPPSSTLAWKIPWMEEPGRLQSMGSLRVRHD
uniref:TOR signaling pathway regulator n=1 Tax=Ovis aries TaxID=9940 RepID=A0AC11EHM3_SHEEP